MKKAFLFLLPAVEGRAFAQGAQSAGWTNAFAPPAEWLLAIAGVALLAAFIVVGVMKAKLKTAAHRQQADMYMRQESLTLTKKDDLFLYETVERRQRPSDEKKNQTK